MHSASAASDPLGGHSGTMHIEILKGRTNVIPVVWLAPEAAGRDLTTATSITFGLRTGPETESLDYSQAGAATGVNSAAVTITDESSATIPPGRYYVGVKAAFPDGTVFQIAAGSALVARSTP